MRARVFAAGSICPVPYTRFNPVAEVETEVEAKAEVSTKKRKVRGDAIYVGDAPQKKERKPKPTGEAEHKAPNRWHRVAQGGCFFTPR